MWSGTGSLRTALVVCMIGWGAPVHAQEMPEAVMRMLDAGEATGDPAKAKAVYDAARAAYPELKAEIDRLEASSRQRLADAADERRLAARQETAESGFFSHWSGRGEVGVKHSTGNSDEFNFTAALLLRRTGTTWRHRLTARAEFESTDKVTTTENYFLAYQPSYEIGSDLFLYALGQYEKDEFQGFSDRYSVSGGLGYRPFDQTNVRLELKLGPAWRDIEYLPTGGESHFAGHVAADFEWQFAKDFKFTETAGAYLQQGTSTIYSHTGLEAGVGKGLKARLSYSFEYDTALPDNVKEVDTTSRFTLLYDF